MNDATTGFIIVLVLALCEGVKQAGILDSRFIPLLSAVLGIILTVLFAGPSFISTIAGVILGLSVTGGYRLVKTSILNQ